ncbi:MAG: hypothetical protein PHH54_04060 [Candidatus Nanoarchaeia archaeon]|nr:hypothetical protein [Candidatus Nanoarchaeia archaeon]MDD5741134.1 hypothetical protein [Candidatus Nanoarchaeia archaeon]
MEDSLKKLLEELVGGDVKTLKANNLGIKRIVLFSSGNITDSMREALNYTENCFLSTQFKIGHGEIKVEIIPWYNCGRYFQEGDYRIDVGAYLKSNFLKSS